MASGGAAWGFGSETGGGRRRGGAAGGAARARRGAAGGGEGGGVNVRMRRGGRARSKGERRSTTTRRGTSRRGTAHPVSAPRDTSALARARRTRGENNEVALRSLVAASNCHDDIVNLLLERGVEVNAKDERGLTAPVAAAMGGCAATMKIL